MLFMKVDGEGCWWQMWEVKHWYYWGHDQSNEDAAIKEESFYSPYPNVEG